MRPTVIAVALLAFISCQPPEPPVLTLLVDGAYGWTQEAGGPVEITYMLHNLTNAPLEYGLAFSVAISDGTRERFAAMHLLAPAVTETFSLTCDIGGREAVSVSLSQ